MTNQTPEERLAALENEKKHDQKFQDEVRTTLRKLPSRIARRTHRQIEECQRRHAEACGILPATTSGSNSTNSRSARNGTSSIIDMIDSKNIVKILLICIVVGGLIGGFVYQYRNPDYPITSIVQPSGK